MPFIYYIALLAALTLVIISWRLTRQKKEYQDDLKKKERIINGLRARIQKRDSESVELASKCILYDRYIIL
jgi:hypothetical protein